MDRFTVHEGGKPDNEKKDEYEQAICTRCNGSHFIETTLAPMYHKNKIVGGTPSYICIRCFSEGAIVQIAF